MERNVLIVCSPLRSCLINWLLGYLSENFEKYCMIVILGPLGNRLIFFYFATLQGQLIMSVIYQCDTITTAVS
jgi:hypothetical protein